MCRIIFLGESDNNFTEGKIYQLIKIEATDYEFKTFISNNYNEIVYIPYKDLDAFNYNWEVVDE